MDRNELRAAAELLRRLPDGTTIDLDSESTATKHGHFWTITATCGAYGRQKMGSVNHPAMAKRIVCGCLIEYPTDPL